MASHHARSRKRRWVIDLQLALKAFRCTYFCQRAHLVRASLLTIYGVATTTVYLIHVLAGRHCMQRKKLVVAIKTGQWLHLELGKSAPAFGEYDSEEAFPAL